MTKNVDRKTSGKNICDKIDCDKITVIIIVNNLVIWF